jgi:hypothetical protein
MRATGGLADLSGRTAKGTVRKGGTRHLARIINHKRYRRWALRVLRVKEIRPTIPARRAICQLCANK